MTSASRTGTFIAMEYLDGMTLKQFLSPKLMDAEKLLDISIDIAAGLEAAHSRGIIHGDIKPANILSLKAAIPRFSISGWQKCGTSRGPQTHQARLGHREEPGGTKRQPQ